MWLLRELSEGPKCLGDLVLNHRRKRYLRGLKFAEKLMTKRFVTKVAFDFDHAQSEYIDLLEPVEKEVVTSGRGKMCTLVVTVFAFMCLSTALSASASLPIYISPTTVAFLYCCLSNFFLKS